MLELSEFAWLTRIVKVGLNFLSYVVFVTPIIAFLFFAHKNTPKIPSYVSTVMAYAHLLLHTSTFGFSSSLPGKDEEDFCYFVILYCKPRLR